MAQCRICFRHCELSEGQTGFCGARQCIGNRVVTKHYGHLSAIALDPIEKKPLKRFYPGSMILSVGGCGCNLRCPFCQNSEISWSAQAMKMGGELSEVSPAELTALAEKYKSRGNIGVAFTYNEPLVSFEYVRDTARLVHDAGLKNVLVTNGCAESEILDELDGCVDAMNIDLKCFDSQRYSKVLGGDLETVKKFIKRAHKFCHVELTTLVVPGISDDEGELRELVGWVAGIDNEIPLHLTRFFPRFHMTDREATDIALIRRFADIAGEKLKYVYTGNI
ncbi:MAG: AmmeMemoRadiSam system radical SAM enzyme [Ruminococcus sp.]|nr:AmmeMemoRadiSam system radical SAM enzyme [Ruminococcus sp.]